MIKLTSFYNEGEHYKYCTIEVDEESIPDLLEDEDSVMTLLYHLYICIAEEFPDKDGNFQDYDEFKKHVRAFWSQDKEDLDFDEIPKYESSVQKEDISIVIVDDEGHMTFSRYEDFYKVFKKFVDEEYNFKNKQ